MNENQFKPNQRSRVVEENRRLARQLDCGDGVPALMLVSQEPASAPADEADGPLFEISARGFALGATVVGQLLIGLAVAAGGSPLVGIVAAIMLLVSGLALVLVEVVNPADEQ
ncbi:MAG: hypothetical protein ACR2QK_10355 [Acidimicrobiales bacterium]